MGVYDLDLNESIEIEAYYLNLGTKWAERILGQNWHNGPLKDLSGAQLLAYVKAQLNYNQGAAVAKAC